MRAGMHDQPAIYPVLPSRHPDREAWDLMVKPSEGTIWQTCWEYVLSHTLTDAEGAAFWTGANLIAKELAAREAAAEARGAQAVLAAVEEALRLVDPFGPPRTRRERRVISAARAAAAGGAR